MSKKYGNPERPLPRYIMTHPHYGKQLVSEFTYKKEELYEKTLKELHGLIKKYKINEILKEEFNPYSWGYYTQWGHYTLTSMMLSNHRIMEKLDEVVELRSFRVDAVYNTQDYY